MKIEIGFESPSLKMQLKGILPKQILVRLDQDAVAINHLYVRGLLTEPEWTKISKRMIKMIQRAIDSASPKAVTPKLNPK